MFSWLPANRAQLMARSCRSHCLAILSTLMLMIALLSPAAFAQTGEAGAATPEVGGEANLKLPDLSQVNFLGMDGHSLLIVGIIFCFFGLMFGLAIYVQLKNLPVHRSMLRDLRTDLRDLQNLPGHAGQIHSCCCGLSSRSSSSLYFGWLAPVPENRYALRCRSSCCSAWSASRAATAWRGSAFASTPLPTRGRHSRLRGKPYPCYAIPLKAGMSIGMLLISGRTADHAVHPAVRSRAIMRARASSASPSANRWALRPCVSPAASSPRLPTSAPI